MEQKYIDIEGRPRASGTAGHYSRAAPTLSCSPSAGKASDWLLLRIFIGVIVFFFGLDAAAAQPVRTGMEVLRSTDFAALRGKRVGLITNPTGVDARLVSTIDILDSASKAGVLKLAALYAPEHGVRGNVAAGATVATAIDPRSGVRVFSLYGATKKPTAGMLQGIDVLVFDIQDIGSRSYTFISTMGLAMEAAAENGIPFVVLDRPNPLGGIRVEGCERIKEGFSSFVSRYPVPYVHGMTVGEVARFLNGEKLLKNGVQCNLTVIPMQGWERSMDWVGTGLPWVPTSPHIPTPESAFYYPATGTVGELGTLNIGVGYTLPFQTIAAPWIANADILAERLNALPDLRGFRFRPIHYKPFYGSGKDTEQHGVQFYLTDRSELGMLLTLMPFYVLQELAAMYPAQKPLSGAEASRLSMFDKVLGTDQMRNTFVNAGFKVTPALKALWKPSEDFMGRRRAYLLY